MPENREEETAAQNAGDQQSKAAATESESTEAELDLDLEDLDLTVETVEERISPSETNVFDK